MPQQSEHGLLMCMSREEAFCYSWCPDDILKVSEIDDDGPYIPEIDCICVVSIIKGVQLRAFPKL